ncbi:DUF6197 family protein [Streptomyces aureocirculatus]|uniref:DUF6197 family protein n=1 Tax=Streptomyces aureocirculatus TaxID=67275 RepID=UPI0004C7C21F|nr:hypothetical protein [Streptomyces aureocirculatus]
MTQHATVPPPLQRLTRLPLPPLAAVYRKAARLLAQAGHRQTEIRTAFSCPPAPGAITIMDALRAAAAAVCAAGTLTCQEQAVSRLGDHAVYRLALRLEVRGQGPFWIDIASLEEHITAWGDMPRRTTESVVAQLERAADASERSV